MVWGDLSRLVGMQQSVWGNNPTKGGLTREIRN